MSVSQGDLLGNFTALGEIFGTNTGAPGVKADHFPWQATSNAGLHQQVTLPVVLGADPVLSAAVTGMLYSKTVSGATQPFFAGWNGSSTTVIPLNATGITPVLNPGVNGSLVFPGIFQIVWGLGNLFTNNPNNVTFSRPFTTCYSVQVSPSKNTNMTDPILVSTGSISPTGFRVTTSNSTGNALNPLEFFFLAVGSPT